MGTEWRDGRMEQAFDEEMWRKKGTERGDVKNGDG